MTTMDADSGLKAVLEKFDVRGPDADDLVWLILRGPDGRQGMVNLGSSNRIVAQAALELKVERDAVLRLAETGERP